MTPSSISVTLLAGIAAIAMTVPAAASLTISGSTHTRPLQATEAQYAQDFSHGSRAVDYGYKSKKSAKSKKHTTGQAKSTKTDTTKTNAPK
jgi:hypothetical protein